MSAQPNALQARLQEQLASALRPGGLPGGNGPEADIAERLIKAEARSQQLRDVLTDAVAMADNLAAVLTLLVMEGTMYDKQFPQHVAGTIRLCDQAMGDLVKRLGEAP